jgi:type I restriction enzyme S subunit
VTRPIRTLAEVARWGSGGTPRRSESRYFGEGVPWLSIADLNDGVVTQAKESLTALGVDNSSAKVVPAGTLLVAMYGSIGKLGIAGMELCTSQAIAFARPDPSIIDSRYLFHFLLAERSSLQGRGRGGTQMNISQGDLKAWPIPVPPVDEQRRIAAILDQADALRAKRRQALAHLNDLTQSIFLDMFGGEDLPRVCAGQLMPTMRNGLSPSTAGQCSATVLTLSAVTRGSFDPTAVKPGQFAAEPPADKRVSAFDFMMCRGNGNKAFVGVGTFSRADRPDLVFPDTVIAGRIDPSIVSMVFLEAAWRQQRTRSQIEALARTTNGTYKVNQQTLATVEVPLPPLVQQEEFAARADRIQAQRDSMESGLAQLEDLFASLQHQAFRGEV